MILTKTKKGTYVCVYLVVKDKYVHFLYSDILAVCQLLSFWTLGGDHDSLLLKNECNFFKEKMFFPSLSLGTNPFFPGNYCPSTWSRGFGNLDMTERINV